MKKCPTCGTAATDDDAFCEADGSKLVAEAPVASITGRSRSCPFCGLADADEGDGYCGACGLRIDPASSASRVAIGDVLGSGEGRLTVIATREADDVIARRADGTALLVAFGSTEELAREEAGLQVLSADPAFPRVDSMAPHEARGSFLVVSKLPDGAKAILEVGPGLALRGGLSLARLALDLAATIESKRLVWEPRASDLFVCPNGALGVARLRGAATLTQGARLNAKRVLEAVGDALLPFPLAHAGPVLVRPFCRAGAELDGPLTVEEARRGLDAPDPGPPQSTAELAELCDPGLKRDHNEDATAIAAGGSGDGRWSVLVVCDGVSSSTHAEEASTIAARTTRDALAHFAQSGDIAFEGSASAMKSAICVAHVAVCATQIEYGDTAPPGTTLVAALVHKHRLTIGWVGDSRAYWVSPGGSELLSHDHSWVNETVARGEMTESEAMAAPLAHALTKCVGPLEVGDGKISEMDPEVRVRQLPGPGHVILCTDGLWNYFPSAPDIAILVRSAGAGANAAVIARVLVNHALAKGGADNVSVGVVHYTPFA